MLNLKNNENDAVFDEICKKFKKKFQKIKDIYFFGQIPWLKSYQPPLVNTES